MAESGQALKRSIQSAWLNIVASLFLRLVTFVVNAYVLRRVTREVLGVGVRTTLLFDTVLFLSREAFRKACLNRPATADGWRALVNLVWLAVPVGAVLSAGLSHLWIRHLEKPGEGLEDQYARAVYAHCASALLVLSAEPFYVVGQACLRVKFRATVDLVFVVLNCLLQCAVVTVRPDKAVEYGAYASAANSAVYLTLHLAYFDLAIRSQNRTKKGDDGPEQSADELIPFDSIRGFFPSRPCAVDGDRAALSWSFFKQGCLKQVLTEGEKYMFTWFSLMTLAEQGVYDVIANLGSIPARLFFAKLEESAHLYFSHTVTRGGVADPKKEEEPSRHLHVLLKGLILLGLVVCVFGVSYSHLLLHMYGGALLSDGLGPLLMRAHCFYVIFLAVNGVSECYAFAVMTAEEVSRYNHLLLRATAAFLALTWIFAKALGPVGFTVANVCNFSLRIAHNVRVIRRRHAAPDCPVRPLEGLAPSAATVLALAASGVACQLSERLVYDPISLHRSAAHVTLGALAFASTLLVIGYKEKFVRDAITNRIKRKTQ